MQHKNHPDHRLAPSLVRAPCDGWFDSWGLLDGMRPKISTQVCNNLSGPVGIEAAYAGGNVLEEAGTTGEDQSVESGPQNRYIAYSQCAVGVVRSGRKAVGHYRFLSVLADSNNLSGEVRIKNGRRVWHTSDGMQSSGSGLSYIQVAIGAELQSAWVDQTASHSGEGQVGFCSVFSRTAECTSAPIEKLFDTGFLAGQEAVRGLFPGSASWAVVPWATVDRPPERPG